MDPSPIYKPTVLFGRFFKDLKPGAYRSEADCLVEFFHNFVLKKICVLMKPLLPEVQTVFHRTVYCGDLPQLICKELEGFRSAKC
ncbi:hypothetical protein E2542_SST20238 [Spatholobus suberectus]|nr:hypothetical protein E2542_SST20238 [Spatholobus suberectus]